ncbi:hypothetical protein Pla52n_60160 [Stieleria varia]|uniref:Uncharacterized protein n=1 Tax=Stieleria varia TaxID=2528005 RepID=A0A5C6A1S6_9BACT|nr:hypothetical protein Pla52n_60160 [Stieleria varia]
MVLPLLTKSLDQNLGSRQASHQRSDPFVFRFLEMLTLVLGAIANEMTLVANSPIQPRLPTIRDHHHPS